LRLPIRSASEILIFPSVEKIDNSQIICKQLINVRIEKIYSKSDTETLLHSQIDKFREQNELVLFIFFLEKSFENFKVKSFLKEWRTPVLFILNNLPRSTDDDLEYWHTWFRERYDINTINEQAKNKKFRSKSKQEENKDSIPPKEIPNSS
jgi:hypothetical protein